MCKRRLASLVRKGMLALETLLCCTQLANIVDRNCILGAVAILFKDNHIIESDLDTYVTNTWITSEEKGMIINEANTL